MAEWERGEWEMRTNRRDLIRLGLGVGAASLAESSGLAEMFRTRGMKVKIGATDWNLQQECKVEAVDLAKRIGFDGVEVSLGVGGNDKLPFADRDIQRKYVEESKRLKLPIASTCLNILH